MTTTHKPLSAGEIEDAKKYSTWLHSMAEKYGKGGVPNVDGRALGRAGDSIDRLLSMHQPPPDAEVREAIGRLESCAYWAEGYESEYCSNVKHTDIRTLLRYAQAPRCIDPTAPVHPCANCGKPVHTCEGRDASGENNHVCPAHPEGAELSDSRWVCSEECADAALCARVVELEGERDNALLSKYAPLGDNHHNAWACPHCNENRETPAQLEARATRADAELAEHQRWETGFRNIVTRTIGPRAPFEIEQVVNLVGEAWAERDEARAKVEKLEKVLKDIHSRGLDRIESCKTCEKHGRCSYEHLEGTIMECWVPAAALAECGEVPV